MSTRHWLLVAQLALFTFPHEARAADRVQECIGEHVEAQLLRKQGHLVTARARLLECAAPTCPALVRDECAALARDVEAALPSVTLSAVDANGPTSAALVSIDGSSQLVPPDGRSVVLDPGEHQLRFQHPDGQIREVKLVLAESEHGRPVVADFRPKVDSESKLAEREWPRTVVLASAGVAAVALGSFTYFALSGRAVQDDLERCKPNCEDHDEVDRMRSRYLIADVSLGVALVAVGVGAYAWFQHPSAAPSAGSQGGSPLSISLQPLATQRHVGLWATGKF
jgi:hypothetical protein